MTQLGALYNTHSKAMHLRSTAALVSAQFYSCKLSSHFWLWSRGAQAEPSLLLAPRTFLEIWTTTSTCDIGASQPDMLVHCSDLSLHFCQGQ